MIPAIFLGLVLTGFEVDAQEWTEYKRQHFIIYYKNAPLNFVETVEQSAEQYYAEITKNLGFTRFKAWNWEDRGTIYIYDDSGDYVTNGKQAGWSHGVASPRDRVIRTFPSAHGFFDSTLPHELGHIIFREFIGFKAQVPAWFEEGVAMYQEKARRWGAHDTVRAAIKDGTFKSLNELSLISLRYSADNNLVSLFYAESASVVNFLITEYGQQRFVRFCRKLKEGGPFDWAMDSAYVRFKDTDALNAAWVKYLTDE